jgi:hypothetical protein
MSSLAAQRCLNHETREAASRCPQCRKYFCRECVVPFEDRMLCSACLAQNMVAIPQTRGTFSLGGLLLAAAGFLLVWFIFYLAGWTVLQWRERAPAIDNSRALWLISA